MKPLSSGIHHITAITRNAQRNIDFYSQTLGLRLVKVTVNFDDPTAYHFYFGDSAGAPGTILTFFVWPHAPKGVPGRGEVHTTAFAIARGSLDFWRARLTLSDVEWSDIERFGEAGVQFHDGDGLMLELIETAIPEGACAWQTSQIDSKNAIGGFHSATIATTENALVAPVIADILGWELVAQDGNRCRFASRAVIGKWVDIAQVPGLPRAINGIGSVHHIAFRAENTADQTAFRALALQRGAHVSPVMERHYFRSIYFRVPDGVLFEIATDAPGFAVDETPETLGNALKLPPELEIQRQQIEAVIQPVTLPSGEKIGVHA